MKIIQEQEVIQAVLDRLDPNESYGFWFEEPPVNGRGVVISTHHYRMVVFGEQPPHSIVIAEQLAFELVKRHPHLCDPAKSSGGFLDKLQRFINENP